MKVRRIHRAIVAAAALAVGFLFLNTLHLGKPRILAVNEVPIAFWAWRTKAPGTSEVHRAFAATNSDTLFLRSGQMDYEKDRVQRIRPVSGPMPTDIRLHLVYNGTRNFLRSLDKVEPDVFAIAVAETFHTDVERARNDGANVEGVQLDFDVPTRLLSKYAQILQALRERLSPDAKLSITGLPDWAAADSIKTVLANVDFWIPQCYGGEIPVRSDKQIPISSAADVGRTVALARRLNKPFYAGLSAYGYLILYGKDGRLIELRGDVDPALTAKNPGLELIDRGSYKGSGQASEIRYVYLAKSDLVLDGMIVEAGETLVVDLPTAASLRAGARAVRENAGDALLGICLFRLPTTEDATTLSIGEIVAAINNVPTKAATMVTLEYLPDGRLKLIAANNGNASSQLTDNAMSIELAIPSGSVSGVTNSIGFTAFETLCRSSGTNIALPCSQQRADTIRLKARGWKPGVIIAATLSLSSKPPPSLRALVTTALDDGRVERESFELQMQNRGE